MKIKVNKLGYHAPRGLRVNDGFMTIQVEDLHWCDSHDFWFNIEEQDKMLHEGKPCIHTDSRYHVSRGNSFRRGEIGWSRLDKKGRGGMTLKKTFRLLKHTRNLPVGTIAEIVHNCSGVFRRSKNYYGLGYTYKVRKENIFDPKYEVNKPSYTHGFKLDEKADQLTSLMRDNGFIIRVFTLDADEYTPEVTEYAIAYGQGLRVGFTSNDSDSLTTYGKDNVLFDKWDEFDKWQKCREILKTTPNEEILQILLGVKDEGPRLLCGQKETV